MVQRLAKRIPNPEDVLEMEPEELGGVILRSLVEDGGQVHFYNFVNGLNQMHAPYPAQFLEPLKRAIGEAWGWLEAQGLIASKGDDWKFITRRGQQVASQGAFLDFRRATLLPRELLHPAISGEAWRTFIRSNFQTAVFEAFKAVEEAVREAGGFSARDLGVDLMRRAFNPENGPLSDMSLIAGEREALSALFAGAIGSYKNPISHRTVSIKDATEAAEMLILASHLLRIVDARRSLAVEQ